MISATCRKDWTRAMKKSKSVRCLKPEEAISSCEYKATLRSVPCACVLVPPLYMNRLWIKRKTDR